MSHGYDGRMYEFDSVSASSFEARGLAARLTEKSADGWEVVAIVTAGSDVVAYLKRAADGAGAARSDTSGAIDVLGTTKGTGSDRSDGGEGWAASPSQPGGSVAASGWSGGTSAGTSGSSWGTGAPVSGSSTGSSWGGQSQHVPATQPAAAPQVPAGWYADPAGRFELRYWDGGAWTEHVSRAGQQFTDPPVA